MFEDMFKLVKTGEVDATVAAVKAELERGTSPQAILNDGLLLLSLVLNSRLEMFTFQSFLWLLRL